MKTGGLRTIVFVAVRNSKNVVMGREDEIFLTYFLYKLGMLGGNVRLFPSFFLAFSLL